MAVRLINRETSLNLSQLSKDSLENTLLIADPSLQDGIFDRTVIHIAGYSQEDGAVGYIMNKPTEKTVGEILQGEVFETLKSIPIYFGGPVQTDQIVFSAYWWDQQEDFHYRLRISADEATQMRGKPGCLLLAHVGHSAWQPNQLELELQEQAWVNVPVSSDTISVNHTKLWKTLLVNSSPYHKLLAMTPRSVRVN